MPEYETLHKHLLFAGDDWARLSGRTGVLMIEDKQEEEQTRTLREVQSQALERRTQSGYFVFRPHTSLTAIATINCNISSGPICLAALTF